MLQEMSVDQGARARAGLASAAWAASWPSRSLEAGHELAVYNRTKDKAQALSELGATIVDSPAELADRDIVFTMVGGSDDYREVVTGPDGLLSRADAAPDVIVDSTTISATAGAGRSRRRLGRGGASAGGARQRKPEGGGERPAHNRRVGSARSLAAARSRTWSCSAAAPRTSARASEPGS